MFLSDILEEAWFRRELTIEVLKPDVDNSGYDLALQCGKNFRYVQLKSSKQGASTKKQTLNAKLAQKRGGCAIWMFQDKSDSGVSLTYRFFGKSPNEHPDLGGKIGKHTKANAQGEKKERSNTRVVPKSRFDEPVGIADLFDKLFPDAAAE